MRTVACLWHWCMVAVGVTRFVRHPTPFVIVHSRCPICAICNDDDTFMYFCGIQLLVAGWYM